MHEVMHLMHDTEEGVQRRKTVQKLTLPTSLGKIIKDKNPPIREQNKNNKS